MTRFLGDRSQQQASHQHVTPRFDREGLAAWASDRYRTVIDEEELRPMLRAEIEGLLLKLAHEQYRGVELEAELNRRLEAAFPAPSARNPAPTADEKAARELAEWAAANLGAQVDAEDLAEMPADEARSALCAALDARCRPEMREMEKVVMLQILDAAWMEHLRAMDHLRSSIGLQGYAQIDPKVEYKRKGCGSSPRCGTASPTGPPTSSSASSTSTPSSSRTWARGGSSTGPRRSTSPPTPRSPRWPRRRPAASARPRTPPSPAASGRRRRRRSRSATLEKRWAATTPAPAVRQKVQSVLHAEAWRRRILTG
ncbi:hypothetical protein [Aquisphaera giovannonii]|uniref:hypothetical protein n=1 Tax=Aquisphaera giovannonii TaxID=406548 RepID=UPI00143D8D10